MFEKFTDRSRKVMQLAKQEAHRFRHEYIGTEHLLLGLVKEGSGVAAAALKNFGADLRTIRDEVERSVSTGDATGDYPPPMTPSLKKVLASAIDEAKALNHNYVGTEHLLLGLLREKESAAAQVLIALGANLDRVAREVKLMIDFSPNDQSVVQQQQSDESPADLRRECRQYLRQQITQHIAGHVFLGEVILHASDPDEIPMPSFPSVAASVVQFADAIAKELEAKELEERTAAHV